MPARIVMVNGDKFMVDAPVNEVGDKLKTEGTWPTFDVEDENKTRRVYVASSSVAYVEEYDHPDPPGTVVA